MPRESLVSKHTFSKTSFLIISYIHILIWIIEVLFILCGYFIRVTFEKSYVARWICGLHLRYALSKL